MASGDLSALFNDGNPVWSGVAGLTQPNFDAGRIGASVDSARATREALVAQYQNTVQSAFREADDALVSRAKLRYENGYTSYLEVIDADCALFSADLNPIATQSAVLGASLERSRALGGTWMDKRIEAQAKPAG